PAPHGILGAAGPGLRAGLSRRSARAGAGRGRQSRAGVGRWRDRGPVAGLLSLVIPDGRPGRLRAAGSASHRPGRGRRCRRLRPRRPNGRPSAAVGVNPTPDRDRGADEPGRNPRTLANNRAGTLRCGAGPNAQSAGRCADPSWRNADRRPTTVGPMARGRGSTGSGPGCATRVVSRAQRRPAPARRCGSRGGGGSTQRRTAHGSRLGPGRGDPRRQCTPTAGATPEGSGGAPPGPPSCLRWRGAPSPRGPARAPAVANPQPGATTRGVPSTVATVHERFRASPVPAGALDGQLRRLRRRTGSALRTQPSALASAPVVGLLDRLNRRDVQPRPSVPTPEGMLILQREAPPGRLPNWDVGSVVVVSGGTVVTTRAATEPASAAGAVSARPINPGPGPRPPPPI